MNTTEKEIPMVRVNLDDDVFEAIQKRAEPLVDDVNSVLRRELRIGEPADRHPPQGALLHIDEYVPATLRALGEAGAFAEQKALQRGAVKARVGELLEARLSDHDYSRNASGRVRWEHRSGWVLTRLKHQGLVTSDGHGHWWLTDAGRTEYEALG